MSKDLFFTCCIISLICAFAKHLLCAAGGDKAAKILSTSLSIIIVLLFCNSLTNQKIPKVELNNFSNNQNFENVSKDTLEKIYNLAEENAGKMLCAQINRKFQKLPFSCVVSINREEMQFNKIAIYFSISDNAISTYELKKYISNEYGINPEVIFS